MSEASVAKRFYGALVAKDWASAGALYADDAVFSDEVFVNLNAMQVRAMWQMLLTRGKDLKIDYEVLAETGTEAHARWVATYTFSQTGRKVVNDITAVMQLRDGKIVRHTDAFDFYRWARQALGPAGVLLGWTNWVHNRVQVSAMNSLKEFMSKQPVDAAP